MWHKMWYMLCTTCRPQKSTTVRYAFPLIALISIFAGTLASVVSEDLSYLEITATPSTVQAGDVFFVTVTAVAKTPVNAVDIMLEFPKLQMEILGIDTGNSVITLWTEEPYFEDGVLYMRGGTFRKGFLGEHEIAKVRVRATESGSAYIKTDTAQFIAGDGKGTEVMLADTGTDQARIYITNSDGTFAGTASVELITDIDGDGKVDLRDISAFMSAWFKENNIFDFNGDGRMTFSDFSILLADSFFN